ncbi:UDP-2,3-diacylglucosamine diphosphatase LpxI [Salipiger sp. P9]|uniref:LpxI family protein n=1 Tax=Salipiger pentaromativorans TaxID=2943193 RepID=UPI0021572329|nr:UDP-2,3-diacylglucosamine diphosphatase LpxI [Salipiger pentaromativorans]MCR8547304.1 UDP-2,3-diacylglucosamine diphosphatase LpxI [Salipiger pentaromativorans]
MLALIAGQGALPGAVAEAAGEAPLVCALDGFPPDTLRPDLSFRLETLGTLLAELKVRGVTRLCMCGAIRRPQIDPARIDAATAPLVPLLMQALQLGDDGALRAVIGIFEAAGIAVIGAHEAAPGLLPAAGVPTEAQPGSDTPAEAALGDTVSAAQAAQDLGQACVIRGAQVIAREGEAGTDAMLAALAPGAGGILYKAEKPGQERRADLPVIGPRTAEGVIRAGLDGIVISAGGVMVLDRDKTLAALDAAGKFLWVRERG